ncbi:MAG TPA: hypothetical protein VE174_14055 [Actinomycetota bacterium]|nr:hypothetical protein [Actinomycetota bacterium]
MKTWPVYLTFAAERPLREFLTDPTLTIACVLLIVVSIGWVVVWRLIIRRMKRAALSGGPAEAPRSPRDIWAFPPR